MGGIVFLTYGHPAQQILEELVIVDQTADDLLIVGHIDEHGEGIFRDGRVILDQKFEVDDGFQVVVFEQTGLGGAVSDKVLGGCDDESDSCSFCNIGSSGY